MLALGVLVQTSEDESGLVLCPDCGLLQRRVALAPRARAYCARCHAELYREPALRLDVMLALALTGLLVWIPANLLPMVSLQAQGSRAATSLFGTVLGLWRQEMQPVALLVLFTAILVPLLQLSALTYLLFSLSIQRLLPGFVPLLHLLGRIHPWGMAEVFLMGVLVALVKLSRLAEVAPGVGLWSFCVLIVLLAVNASLFDTQGLWRHYQILRRR